VTQQKTVISWERAADIVLLGGTALSLAAIGYLLYYYSWTGQAQFGSPRRFVSYYVILVMIAALMLACLRLKLTYRINVAIFSVSLFLSIYFTEVCLTYAGHTWRGTTALWGIDSIMTRPAEIAKLEADFGVKIDARPRAEVIKEFHRQGIAAVPVIATSTLLRNEDDGSLRSVINISGNELLPLGGIANRVTVFCNESGSYTIYKSEEHGFHNPAGIWNLRQADILALGDSFTQGGCVPADKNFVALIRDHYPATLNLANAGHGPLSMLAVLKESLSLIRPKWVLWFYSEDDPLELRVEHKSPLLMRYLERDFRQDLIARQSSIDQALSDYLAQETAATAANRADTRVRLITKQTVYDILKLSAWRSKLTAVTGEQLPSFELTDTEAALFRRILIEAKTLVTASGGELHFVYLPNWERYGNGERGRKDRDRVLTMVTSLGIPVTDVHRNFRNHRDPLSLFPFRRFGHYTEEGHALVAKAVLRSIAAAPDFD